MLLLGYQQRREGFGMVTVFIPQDEVVAEGGSYSAAVNFVRGEGLDPDVVHWTCEPVPGGLVVRVYLVEGEVV